ncbi:hypothetical protein PHJA_003008700 [Phtheirospermum japonicum]|uniref:Uncharacterized protein n=1 Tax=Phtheirospermum japonicum TaxID=374723 RepID=A0A830DA02_9LAMI|nr:hypothetical protein PHJA_003008700 [Phtheirospermum japonicum]
MIPMEEDQIPQNHGKKKQTIVPSSGRPDSLMLMTNNKTRSLHHPRHQHQAEEVKLAGLAISFNIRLRAADMPSAMHMQERALRHARALLDSVARRRPNPTLLARLPQKVDSFSFLLFKTQVHVIAQPSPKP